MEFMAVPGQMAGSGALEKCGLVASAGIWEPGFELPSLSELISIDTLLVPPLMAQAFAVPCLDGGLSGRSSAFGQRSSKHMSSHMLSSSLDAVFNQEVPRAPSQVPKNWVRVVTQQHGRLLPTGCWKG